METLTEAELDLVNKSCEGGPVTARRLRVTLGATIVGSVGAFMIVSQSAWQLLSGEIGWNEFWKTAGFVMVLVGSFMLQFELARFRALARSVIAKLCGERRCPDCGQPVAFPGGQLS